MGRGHGRLMGRRSRAALGFGLLREGVSTGMDGSGKRAGAHAGLRRGLAQRAGQTEKAGAQFVRPVERAESKNKTMEEVRKIFFFYFYLHHFSKLF